MRIKLSRTIGAFAVLVTGVAVASARPALRPPEAAQATRSFAFLTIDLPGAAGTFASGINDHGTIVGVSIGVDESAWILENGKFSTYSFGAPGSAELNQISEQGVAAGDYFGDDGLVHGLLLYRGVKTDVDFPGATLTVATITKNGDVVGSWTDSPTFDFPFHGFTFQGGRYESFDHPGATTVGTFGNGNNDPGTIVGTVFDDAGGRSYLKHGDTYQDFLLPGSLYTQAQDINDRGDIVGLYRTSLAPPLFQPEHGFLLSHGQLTLIDVPGAAATRAMGINDRGQIVGFYVDSSGNIHGFLATPTR